MSPFPGSTRGHRCAGRGRPRHADARSRAGLTLIEVAVALAIMAVVTAVVSPAFTDMFKDQPLKGAARDVADALMLGRAEAIRTGDTHLWSSRGH